MSRRRRKTAPLAKIVGFFPILERKVEALAEELGGGHVDRNRERR